VDLYSALQYVLFVAIVTALVKPLGGYMERVFSRKRTLLDRVCLPVERLIYRLTAVNPDLEMSFKEYATCFILFSLAGTLLLYAILRMQQFLPWFFPRYHTMPLSADLALNTAISFSTTTTWQAYAGENTISYFSQMVGLCAQNFLAGAAGLAVGIAFIRGLSRQLSDTLGNFWVDLTRALLWILLPGALLRLAACRAGRSHELPPLCGRHYRRARPAGHTAGSGGRAGDHQESRHEWRRLL
jgi:K+-transporting ATPase ATPase A chain